MNRDSSSRQETHLIRIPDHGVTELLVTFADEFILKELRPGLSVLDIGCGRGVFCRKMAARGVTVTGVDIVREEIEVARRAPEARTSYHCMNAEDLAPLDQQFDMIVSRYCYHHLDIPKAVSGIAASLKPGGRMLVVDCFEGFWRLEGRLHVMKTGARALGILGTLELIPRLAYFFTPSRAQHVQSDIRRLKQQRRYTFADAKRFYAAYFPGCVVGTIGCAIYVDWHKPLLDSLGVD